MKAISDLLETLINKSKVPKDDIAIITLYRGQEALLKKELPGAKSLKVLNALQLQGSKYGTCYVQPLFLIIWASIYIFLNHVH